MAEEKIVIEPVAPYSNHGNTVAAWALCGLLTIGFIIGAVGFDMANQVILIAGVVVMIIGLIAGLVLKKAGYGQGGAKTKYHH